MVQTTSLYNRTNYISPVLGLLDLTQDNFDEFQMLKEK